MILIPFFTKSINSIKCTVKINVNGDSMLGKLDMTVHSISKVKFPLNSGDAINKLYAQIYVESDDTDTENLCIRLEESFRNLRVNIV